MFKKLKEKIAEEVKPLKIPQFAPSVVIPSSNVNSPLDDSFSLDDELPEDLLGNEGFSVVDLHHPSLPVPLSSGRFSRQSSMSSLASDASAFLPIHDVSLGAFNMQDMESASEREDVFPQMSSLSKQELCNSYLKLYRHYQKYKGRAADLKNFCKELEKDNKKHKTVLLECQEKSLRRMAELKEQCALEQHAKAHLEEALRNDLEEKDHLIQTLQTKIKLLKDAHLANSSAAIRNEDENLLTMPDEMDLNNMTESIRVGESQTSQLQHPPGCVTEVKSELDKFGEERKIQALQDRIEFFYEQVTRDLNIDLKDVSVKTQLQDLLNDISHCLIYKISTPVLSSQREKTICNNAVDKILLENKSSGGNSENNVLGKFLQNSTVVMNEKFSNTQLDSSILESCTCNQSDHSSEEDSAGSSLKQINKFSYQNMESKFNSKELENELSLTKEKFKDVSLQLVNSQQMISEQNCTITTLQKNLDELESEVNAYKNNIIESNDCVKFELAETKKQLDELQQQLITAQIIIEKKDLEINDAKQSLLKVQQELEHMLNTEKSISLTQNLQAADEVLKDRESTIPHLYNEIADVYKELEVEKSQKIEGIKRIRTLENELKEIKLKCQQITEELSFKSKSINKKETTIADLKSDITMLHKELHTLYSENSEASTTVSNLHNEMSGVKLNFEETTNLLETVLMLVKERDSLNDKFKEDLTSLHQELDTVSKEKTDARETILGLQNELSCTKSQIEKMNEELQSAHESIDLKDSEIGKIQENFQQQLYITSSESIEKSEVTEAIEKELKLLISKIKELTQKFQDANRLNEKKDKEITNLRLDLEKVKEELNAALLLKDKNLHLERKFQNSLLETKLKLEEKNDEINSYRKSIGEKDLTIANVNNDVVVLKKNLELESTQKNEAIEISKSYENELVLLKRCLKEVTTELQSTQKLVEEKDTSIDQISKELSTLHEKFVLAEFCKNQAKSEIDVLEEKLKSMSDKFEMLNKQLLTSHNLLEEKELKIVTLTEEVAYKHEELSAIRKELDSIILERNQANEEIVNLQNQHTNMSINFKELNEELQNSRKFFQEKNSIIVSLSEEVASKHEELAVLQKEFDSTTSERDKSRETIDDLQQKLMNMKVNFEELNEELQTSHKLLEQKELIIVSLTEEVNSKHEKLSGIYKEFDLVSLERDKTKEEIKDLQKQLANMSTNFKELNEELLISCKLLEEKELKIVSLTEEIASKHEELYALQNEIDSTTSERDKSREIVDDLQQKLMNMKVNLEELKEELRTSCKLLEEKELNIICLTEEISGVHELLATDSVGKQETNDILSSLKKELTDTKLQFEEVNQKLQSAYHDSKQKDLNISNLTEELSKAREEWEVLNLLKLQTNAVMEDKMDELKNVKLKYENADRQLLLADQMIEEKNTTISHLTEDISKIQKELYCMSSVSDEKCKLLSIPTEEVQDYKTSDKISDDIQTAQRLLQEKDTCIAQLREYLVKVQEELNEASAMYSKANENIIYLQQELKDTKLRLMKMDEEVETSQQKIGNKNVLCHENVDIINAQVKGNIHISHEEETSESTHRIELDNNTFEIDKMSNDLQVAHRITEEECMSINKTTEDLTEAYKETSALNDNQDKDLIENALNKKLLENTFHLRNTEDKNEPDLDSVLMYSNNDMNRSEHLCENSDIFYNMNLKIKRGENSSIKVKPFRTVMCSDREKEKIKIHKLQICSVENTSFIPEGAITLSHADCNIALNDSCTNQGPRDNARGSVLDCEDPDRKSLHNVLISDSTSTSQIVSVSGFSPLCKNKSCLDKVVLEDDKIGLCEGDTVLNSCKFLECDGELISEDVPVLQFQKKTDNRNIQALQTMDQDKECGIDKLQFSSIQNILEEIQKENKEYGSLLECHKNIINHLEGITTFHSEGMQPDKAEWLHKQLVLLSQKLYDTKEKQRIQIASINRFVKHQQDLMKCDGHESDMTIEMKYLRNIVFQYMIGKETMLLAKVISAIMKFDQQQMDQVMQKEQQKQTLLGHLGLL